MSRDVYTDMVPSDRLYGPLIDTANRLSYTLYPIEADGIDQPFSDASIGSLREANAMRESRSRRDQNREGVLANLAQETGGQAYLDGNGRSVLEKVLVDSGSYFWIGFTPTWRENDRRHRVRVIYKGEGKVRTRRSFSDLSRSTETTMQMESAQLFDLPLASAAPLQVRTSEIRKAGLKRVVVMLEVQIPLDHVTLLPNGQGWGGSLELRVAVTDNNGDRADIPVVPIPVFFPKEPGEGETRMFTTGFKMRKRPHRLLVSLHDVPSGEALTTQLDVVP